jgi:hypothetical protein
MQLGFALASTAALFVLMGMLLYQTRTPPEDMKKAAIQWPLGLSFFFLVLTFVMDLVVYVLR